MAITKIDCFTTNARGERVLPPFSMAEHDRRLASVQKLMADAGLDCLIVPPADLWEIQSNSRYLTQVGGQQGGAWAVVPGSGAETAILGSEREHMMWRANLVWPVDMRWSNKPVDVVIERQRSLPASVGMPVPGQVDSDQRAGQGQGNRVPGVRVLSATVQEDQLGIGRTPHDGAQLAPVTQFHGLAPHSRPAVERQAELLGVLVQQAELLVRNALHGA